MLDPENREMFTASYVIIFAFDSDLNIKRIVVERSFGQSAETRYVVFKRYNDNAAIKRLCY